MTSVRIKRPVASRVEFVLVSGVWEYVRGWEHEVHLLLAWRRPGFVGRGVRTARHQNGRNLLLGSQPIVVRPM
jgi:hypothetical protein